MSSSSTSTAVATPPPVPPTAAPPAGRRRALVVAVALLAAWVVPLLAYALHVAGLLPPLVLVTTAALLRVGRTLLDRLVLAAALLLGAICAAGLLFSYWPWGLHPVPVAGSALTVLLGYALVTGVRPRLPRPTAADLAPVLAAAFAALALAWPYLRADGLAGRLAYAMTGEDNSRHLATMEGIRAVGGYLFAHSDAAARIAPEGMVYYPQGFHLTAALLDTFLRSSTAPGGPASTLDHYLGWALAAYALLVLAVVWAAGRIAGRLLDPVRAFALAGAVTALALGSELTRFVVYGYPGESLGLALTAILIGLVCRPVARTGTQLCLLGALCVGIGFAYLMFLPVVGVLVLAWLVRHRRAVRRRPWLLVTVALVTAVLTPLPSVAGLLFTDQVDNVATGGGVFPRYDAFLALAGVVGAGLAAGGLRLPVWRRYVGALAATVAFALGFRIYFQALGTDPRYYYGKTLHLLLVVLLIGLGAVLLLRPVPWRAASPAGARPRAARLARVAVALSLVAGAAGVAGLLRGGGVFAQPFGNRSTTWAQAWWSGTLDRPRQADVTVRALAQAPARPGEVTVVVSDHRREGYLETLFVATLQGSHGDSAPAFYNLPLSEPARSAAVVAAEKRPIRFLTTSPEAAAVVEELLTERPGLRARVTVEPLR
ncbi:hypothetical protein D7147_26960 [Micromonospora musae]|uniref:Glycosyltransferase RgtA/B/C/D-like domain-containing protein n=1 Tax=Micromonospora musae TaxID=1894970 RepID=A0A3A9YM71_9ACTN|nr:hypothetical protein [Micromonospora musae]RKN14927.1 hypothetical protein D7147_26960 [Micromonospora musae]RKN35456.1 hypothetical protein D7044_04645 [Micromonospora musae]